jgi:hypothetical protein
MGPILNHDKPHFGTELAGKTTGKRYLGSYPWIAEHS